MKKQQKAILLGSTVVILAVAVIFGFKYYEQQKYKTAATELTKHQAKVEKLQQALNENFLKDGFLSKNVDTENLEKLSQEVSALQTVKKKEYTDEKSFNAYQKSLEKAEQSLKEATEKADKQEAVNQLFEEPVLTGDEVSLEGIVKEDVKEVASDLVPTTYKDGWSQAMEQLVAVAQEQVKVKEQAEQAVEALFSQEKVKEGITRKDYEEVNETIGQVKNEKVQQALAEKMKQVDQELQRIEEQEKEQAEQEAAAIGGTVEKKEDGSFVVVEPVQESSQQTNHVSSSEKTATSSANSGSATQTQKSGGSSPKANVAPPAKSGGTKSSSSSKQSVKSGEPSSNSSSKQTSNSGKNSDESSYWEYVGKNPNTGGDGYIGKPVENLEDIPGLKFVNGDE